MKSNFIKALQHFVFVTSIALGLVVAGTKPAAAATTTCTPSRIQYSNAPGYQMVTITCGGVDYVAQLSPGLGCTPASPVDAQRFFITLAESALLSGKKLNIGYNHCTAADANFIVSVDLVQ